MVWIHLRTSLASSLKKTIHHQLFITVLWFLVFEAHLCSPVFADCIKYCKNTSLLFYHLLYMEGTSLEKKRASGTWLVFFVHFFLTLALFMLRILFSWNVAYLHLSMHAYPLRKSRGRTWWSFLMTFVRTHCCKQ